MNGGVEGRWGAGRTSQVSGRDAHRGERGIEADERHVSARVCWIGEMRTVTHDRGVAVAHSQILIKIKGWVERGGDIDGRGWLRELVRSLRE